MNMLGKGLCDAGYLEEALSVEEANLAIKRRIGASEESILIVQNNLATRYEELGKTEFAIGTRQEVYSGFLRLKGADHAHTLTSAICYSATLTDLERFEEAKALLRKTLTVARRVLGDSDGLTLQMRWNYAQALYKDPAATLDDRREAVETAEETERIARRVFGSAHPLAVQIESLLRTARAALRAREETPSGGA